MTGDDQGVVISPFNVDVVLLNSRELTVQLVGLLCLFDVKARRKGAGVALMLRGSGGTVELICEAEEW